MEAHAPTATDELLIGHAGDLQNLYASLDFDSVVEQMD